MNRPTRRQSQRLDLSRFLQSQESRQAAAWLIFDVRQKMGNTYKNIFVRSITEDALRSAIMATGHSAYLIVGTKWSAVVPKIQEDRQWWLNQQKLARDISAKESCPVLSCYVHDSDFLLLELWRNGARIGGYGSSEDIDEPAFTSLTPELLASAFGFPHLESEISRLLLRTKSKRALEAASSALTKEYEGRWDSSEFRERWIQLIRSQQIDSATYLAADERHRALCELLELPLAVVGADYKDFATGEAAVLAIHVKGKSRTRRQSQRHDLS